MIVITLGLAMFGAQASPLETLSVDDAVRTAVESAFRIRIAQSNVERARQIKKQAEGALGPRVQLDGTYQRYGEAMGGFPSLGVPGQIDSKSASASLSFPVDISGVNRKSAQAARLAEAAQAEVLASEVSSVKSNVRSAYYNIVRSKWQLDVQRETLQSAELRLDLGKKKLEAGTLANFDVLRLETDVSRAKAGVIDAENQVKLAKSALNNLLARPIDTAFDTEQVQQEPALTATPETYFETAQKSRPELKAAQRRIESLALVRQAEERGLLPSLGLGVTQTHNFNPGFGQKENSTVGVAALTIPLFDSGVTPARVSAARQDELQAKVQLEQASLGVTLEVRQALIRLDNARQLVEVAKTNLTQETEAMRLAQVRFEAGIGIVLDITTAQESLLRARSQLVSANYEYLSAYAELQRATGVDDLGSLQSRVLPEKPL